jgi:hypothetical protein
MNTNNIKETSQEVQAILDELEIPEGKYLELSRLIQRIYNTESTNQRLNQPVRPAISVGETDILKQNNHYLVTSPELRDSNMILYMDNDPINNGIFYNKRVIGKLPYNVNQNTPSTYVNDILPLNEEEIALLNQNFPHIEYRYIPV